MSIVNPHEAVNPNIKLVRQTARRVPITPKRATEAITSLAQIYMGACLGEFAVLDLDLNFKIPIVHTRLKRIKEDLAEIKKHIKRAPIFGELDEDYTLDVVTETQKMLATVVNFTLPDLIEWNKILAQLVIDAKEREENKNT